MSEPYASPHKPVILNTDDLASYEPITMPNEQWNQTSVLFQLHDFTESDVAEILGVDDVTVLALVAGVLHVTTSADGAFVRIPDVMLSPEAVALRDNFARLLAAAREQARPPSLAHYDAAAQLRLRQGAVRRAKPAEELSDEFKTAMREAFAGNLERGATEVVREDDGSVTLVSASGEAVSTR